MKFNSGITSPFRACRPRSRGRAAIGKDRNPRRLMRDSLRFIHASITDFLLSILFEVTYVILQISVATIVVTKNKNRGRDG